MVRMSIFVLGLYMCNVPRISSEAGPRKAGCTTDNMEVTFGMDFYTILTVDEKAETFSSKQTFFMTWRDETLRVADGGHRYRYAFPEQLDCVPYVIIEESVTQLQLPPHGYSLRIDQHTGDVLMAYQATYEGVCKLVLTYYPFDIQGCEMSVYSEVSSLRLTARNVSLHYYYEHNEFTLDGVTQEAAEDAEASSESERFFHGVEGSSGTALLISFRLRRKPLYTIMTLVVPSTLVTIVGVVSLLSAGTTLPSRSSSGQIGLVAMLSMSIQLMTLADHTPVNSDSVPPLSVYYFVLVFVIALCTLVAVAMVHVHHVRCFSRCRVTPAWRRLVLHHLARLLGPCPPAEKGENGQLAQNKSRAAVSPSDPTSARTEPPQSRAAVAGLEKVAWSSDSSLMDHHQANPGETRPVSTQNLHSACSDGKQNPTSKVADAGPGTGRAEGFQEGEISADALNLEWLHFFETLSRFFLAVCLLVLVFNLAWFLKFSTVENHVLGTY